VSPDLEIQGHDKGKGQKKLIDLQPQKKRREEQMGGDPSGGRDFDRNEGGYLPLKTTCKRRPRTRCTKPEKRERDPPDNAGEKEPKKLPQASKPSLVTEETKARRFKKSRHGKKSRFAGTRPGEKREEEVQDRGKKEPSCRH